MPTSTQDGVYVLIYPRYPDWKFCAKKYSVVSSKDGARNITYTDFADGREYTIQLSSKWPRPWQVHEIEILSSNAFLEIWQASKRPQGVCADRRTGRSCSQWVNSTADEPGAK
jgi:hypothetical protein